MPRYNTPFEIHVHGDVQLRSDVVFEQIQDALKPVWKYAGAKSLLAAATSVYEEEPGIRFEPQKHLLQICWTVAGDDDFRQALDEMCMALNELAETGAPIEVTFYDADFDEDEEGDEEQARDDFAMYFVGPTPAAIMQVQRDLLAPCGVFTTRISRRSLRRSTTERRTPNALVSHNIISENLSASAAAHSTVSKTPGRFFFICTGV